MSGVQSLPLRMGSGHGAVLGRFADPISLEEQPLYLYSNAEEIAEDPELPSDNKEKEGTEFNKRKRRNRYRRRTELVLEGGAKAPKNASSLRYIGNVVDTKTENSASRYALLQVVKQVTGDSAKPDVHGNARFPSSMYSYVL